MRKNISLNILQDSLILIQKMRSHKSSLQKIKIHLVLLILLCPLFIFGQNSKEISCNLNVEVILISSPEEDTLFSMYSNICKITQSLQLENHPDDTISLFLENPSPFAFFNSLFFQQLTVYENDKKEAIPYTFNSNILKFVCPNENSNIQIHYYYQPDYFMMGSDDMACVFCPYQQSWSSWFFSTPDMLINSVSFKIPEHLNLFSNLMCKTTDGHGGHLLCDFVPNHNISFFWIEKRFYELVQTSIEKNHYHLYLYKDLHYTGDSTSCLSAAIPAERVNESLIDRHLSALEKGIRNIEKIFKKKVNVSIVEACLDLSQEEDMIRWGSAFQLSEDSLLIVMDTSYWNAHLHIHEIVHAYNDILPSQKDSSYYFFHESMTEFLAIYCNYDSMDERDAVYSDKIKKYDSIENPHNSIFEVEINEISLDYGGSYGIIYLKTPYLIHLFSKKVRDDIFSNILADFYAEIRERKTVNLQLFEMVIKRHGVSDEDWKSFVENL